MIDPAPTRQPLLLSVDFEDWHQLVRRRLDMPAWERPGPALPRQTQAVLDLFDEVGARATFFVLGLAARSHPRLLEQIAERGHEIACHGDLHLPVYTQSPSEFAADLRRARGVIEELTGVAPVGYRAPAFSITRDCPWAYEVLVGEGFAYDSSQHDTPRMRRRIKTGTQQPHPMQLRNGTLWEFPIAVWSALGRSVPVGGASYWAVLPTRLILRGLASAGTLSGLYLHPQELDPQELNAGVPHDAPALAKTRGAYRSAQRNLARRRTADVLRAIGKRHPLIPYGEAHAGLADGAPART